MTEDISQKLDKVFENVTFNDFCWIQANETLYNNEAMAMYLLNEGVLFLLHGMSAQNKLTLSLFVNCNDIFTPASDCEEITYDELPDLCRIYIEEERGLMKWVAKKRSIPAVSFREKMSK